MYKSVLKQYLLITTIFVISLVTTSCTSKKPTLKSVTDQPTARSEKIPDNNYTELDAGSGPLSPLSADFNNDGYNDIAVISHGDSQLRIFWGGPDKTFKPGPVYGKNRVGYHPGKIALVDWNGDGKKDIILACEGTFMIQLWINTGEGFQNKTSVKVPMNAKSIQCGDFDNDGLWDVVLGSHQGNYILLLWGIDNKKFRFYSQPIKANPMAQNVEIGDWNNDGRTDIFWVEKRLGSVAVALNLGNRKFKKIYIKKPGIPHGIVKDGPEYVKIADLDEDGCQDAAVPLEVGKACYIYYGDCKGGVARTEKIPAPEWGYSGIAAVGRGINHPPMLALGEEMKLFIATKTQKGWILNKKPAGSLPRDLIFTDLNGDGIVDLLFANSASNTIGLLYGPF